jgi:hypothetical protein
MFETYPETHRMTFSEMKGNIKIRFICSYLWLLWCKYFVPDVFCYGSLAFVNSICGVKKTLLVLSQLQGKISFILSYFTTISGVT